MSDASPPRSISRGSLTLIGLAAVAIILVSANVLASLLFPSARLDLTQGRLYTLSDGTKQLLSGLPEPITLRLFLSDRLVREAPGYAPYAQRVRDLLAEYQTRSNGKLKVETFDPQPYTDVEDRAEAYGLQGVPINQDGDQVYFGLVGINSTDDEERIPFFQTDRERFLEYDLTRLVAKLSNPKQKTVGLLSSLPLNGDVRNRDTPPWLIVSQLRQSFAIKIIPTSAREIPKEVDVLMIVHPAGLPEDTQYAIDQFVMAGGRVLAFVDPWSEQAQIRNRVAGSNGGGGPVPISDMPKLFRAWGVQLEPGVVVGDRRNARKVNASASGKPKAVDYLPWISLGADQFNQEDAITAQFDTLNFATAGVLKPAAEATTKFERLVWSSSLSQKVPLEKVQSAPPDWAGILRDYKSGDQELTIAARVTGPARTAFPEGAPKPSPTKDADGKEIPPADAAPTAPQLTESKQPIDIIVIADTDMLDDENWAQVQNFFGQSSIQEVANNAGFVTNALDTLAGTSGLITLRSRSVGDRSFTLVKEIQQQADALYSAREEELSRKLKDTQAKLAELRRGEGGSASGAAIVTPEQTKMIEQFRTDLAQTRTALRDVQRDLRADIDGLQSLLRFLNIAAVPILVAVAALVIGILRTRRRRRAHRASAA